MLCNLNVKKLYAVKFAKCVFWGGWAKGWYRCEFILLICIFLFWHSYYKTN